MKVELWSVTPNALQTIAAAKGLIKGEHRAPTEIPYYEAVREFRDCMKSSILTPCEYVDFVFHFEGVSRAFTHQLVRTRMASYVQESLRFSVKSGDQFEYLVPDSVTGNDLYHGAMHSIQALYEGMLEQGVPVEDARGILPTNILTSIVMKIDYRNLINVMEQRMCFQAQGEIRDAAWRMRDLVGSHEPILADYMNPACYRQGYCAWGGSMDRTCSLQGRFPLREDAFK